LDYFTKAVNRAPGDLPPVKEFNQNKSTKKEITARKEGSPGLLNYKAQDVIPDIKLSARDVNITPRKHLRNSSLLSESEGFDDYKAALKSDSSPLV